VINHLGDTMAQIIEQVKLMTRYVFQTETGHILGVAGPGSAAMEMAVANLVVPGSKVLSVSLIGFSNKAWRHIESRTDQLRHWCLDAKLADQFWYKKAYHYTAPVSGILAIHEALRLVLQKP
jgi:aspartate aminotransferase-like enzyme